VVVPLVSAGAAVLILVVLMLAKGGSDGSVSDAVEPRTVPAERRAFTATVPLAATVDVNPGVQSSFAVTARVDPLVLYRLPDRLYQATVKIAGGPPEFSCASVALATVPALGSNNDQSSGASGESFGVDEETGEVTGAPAPTGRQAEATAETVVRCLVPPDVRVFPGLRAELVVITAQLPDAIVVPAGAVEPESAQTGFVTVVDDDDNEVRKAVKVGASNGSVVVINEGVAEGELVLDRVPIQDPGSGSGSDAGARSFVR